VGLEYSGLIMYAYCILVILILIIYYSEEIGLHPVLDVEIAVPFSKYSNKLQTGDIMVLHNGGFISSLIRIYEQSPATHTSLILLAPDGIYVCEVNLLHGLHITKIDDFMKKQRNKYIGIIPAPKEIDLTVEDVKKINYNFDLTLGFRPLQGRIHCSALVHRILANYNILPWNGACEHMTTPKTYYSDPSIIFLDYTK
jgi:hypothetical protein